MDVKVNFHRQVSNEKISLPSSLTSPVVSDFSPFELLAITQKEKDYSRGLIFYL